VGYSRQEYWSGLPFPSPGDLPNPGIKPGLQHCRQTLYHLSHQVRLNKVPHENPSWKFKGPKVGKEISKKNKVGGLTLPDSKTYYIPPVIKTVWYLPKDRRRSLVGCSPFMHWRRKWQPTPVFLPGESQGWGSLVGCHLWGRTESDTTEVT